MDSIIDQLYPIILQADAATNSTVASKEGRAVAYSSLIFMSALSILLGAFRSVKQREVQRKNIKVVKSFNTLKIDVLSCH